MKIKVLLFLFFLGFYFSLYSETVYLKNGDKLTGSLIKEENDRLVLDTVYMGEVSLNKEFIQSIEGIQSEEVISQSQSEQASKIWKGEVSLGFNKTSGNTKSSQFSSELSLRRKTDSDEFSSRLRGFYSSSEKKMNSQKWYGQLRYAYSFWDNKWYNFYKFESSHDRFSNIDYRLTPSAGIGYWFFDAESLKVMAETGLGWEYTEYRDNTKSQSQVILVPRLFMEKVLTGKVKFSQDLVIYPSLEAAGDFRFYSETSLLNPVTDNISLKLSLVNEYDSDPAPGKENSDFQFISSLIYSF
jgi:putative salt-induced outer membrane protein